MFFELYNFDIINIVEKAYQTDNDNNSIVRSL